jgi:hypothetical protein
MKIVFGQLSNSLRKNKRKYKNGEPNIKSSQIGLKIESAERIDERCLKSIYSY